MKCEQFRVRLWRCPPRKTRQLAPEARRFDANEPSFSPRRALLPTPAVLRAYSQREVARGLPTFDPLTCSRARLSLPIVREREQRLARRRHRLRIAEVRHSRSTKFHDTNPIKVKEKKKKSHFLKRWWNVFLTIFVLKLPTECPVLRGPGNRTRLLILRNSGYIKREKEREREREGECKRGNKPRI